MNIAVLFGGISPERNVSIAGGKAVAEALKSKGHNVYPIDPALGANGLVAIEDIVVPEGVPTMEELEKMPVRNIIDCINSPLFDNIDAAFIVLHGKYGEDGRIQSLLELRGIPYTGSGVKASSVGMDKLTSKLLFSGANIPTPTWLTVRKDDYENYEFFEALRDELGNKIIVKPNNQGSTIGITSILNGNLDDIGAGISAASKYSSIVLAEQFIEGRELTVGIVDGTALPVIEIVPDGGFYDYNHKYIKGKTEYLCPAPIDDFQEEFLQNLAIMAFGVIGCSGFGRVDFRMDEEGQVYCLEVNTVPGFTATSLVPKAAAVTGLEFPDLCEKLINIAVKNKAERISVDE